MPKTLIPRRAQRLLLYDVSWQAYERLLRAFDEKRVRLTYDEGTLEIMTLSFRHERTKHLLGLLIVLLGLELGIDVEGCGSLTMRRRLRRKGLEPDECYWIKNAAAIRNLDDYDLRRDPPPDLALEVEITRSALNRMGIYAALRIPEVWSWKQATLKVHLLGDDGTYRQARFSEAFPGFDPQELVTFVELGESEGEAKMIRAFQAWIKKHAGRS